MWDVLLSIKLKQEFCILLSDKDYHPRPFLPCCKLLFRRIFQLKPEPPFPFPSIFFLILVLRDLAIAVAVAGLVVRECVEFRGFVHGHGELFQAWWEEIDDADCGAGADVLERQGVGYAGWGGVLGAGERMVG